MFVYRTILKSLGEIENVLNKSGKYLKSAVFRCTTRTEKTFRSMNNYHSNVQPAGCEPHAARKGILCGRLQIFKIKQKWKINLKNKKVKLL